MDTERRIIRNDSKTWKWLGKDVPKSEITYIVQSIVLVIVIIVSLVNLSLGTGEHDLNICLLCSSLGAFLPGPTFPRHNGRDILKLSRDDVDSSTSKSDTPS
jgi:hypothetical protein